MQPDCPGPEARIDPDEEDVEPGRDDIGYGLSIRRLELIPRWTSGNRKHRAAVSSHMDGARILIAAVLVVTACSAPFSETSPGPPAAGTASPTTRVDQGGNVLPPLVDEATWARLTTHPFTPPSLAPGAPCPKTATATVSPFTGAVAGPGPVYASGNTIFYSRLDDGTLGAKVAWISRPDYTGPALIRGRRLDAAAVVQFDPGYGPTTTDLHFEYDTRVRAAGSDEGWRFLPSTVLIGAPGCYAFQIDGLDWSITIVMDTTANP